MNHARHDHLVLRRLCLVAKRRVDANGRLRRWLPRQIDIDKVSDQEIQDIVITANLTPRKCLGFKIPFQAILKTLAKTCKSGSRKALLHLALESGPTGLSRYWKPDRLVAAVGGTRTRPLPFQPRWVKGPRKWKTTRRAENSFANGWPFRRIRDRPRSRLRHSPKRRPRKTSSTVVGAIRRGNFGAIL